jgi:hypothetical protein
LDLTAWITPRDPISFHSHPRQSAPPSQDRDCQILTRGGIYKFSSDCGFVGDNEIGPVCVGEVNPPNSELCACKPNGDDGDNVAKSPLNVGVGSEKGVNDISGDAVVLAGNAGICNGGGKHAFLSGCIIFTGVADADAAIGLSFGRYFRLDESGNKLFAPLSSITILFDIELFHLFFTALSDRPGHIFAITDHRGPLCCTCSKIN